MEPTSRQMDIEADGDQPAQPGLPGLPGETDTTGTGQPVAAAPIESTPAVHHRAGTRASATWTAVVVGVVVFVALIIFIAGNTASAPINFAGVHGHAPIAVMLLVAAVGGALVVVIAAAGRILQLRRQVGRVPPERPQSDAPVPEAPTPR